MPLRRLLPLLCLLLAAAIARADEADEIQKLARGGDLAGALARAQRAAAATPSDAKVRFLEGVVLLDLHRDAEALAAFEHMTQDFPELADPYNNIAMLQAKAGHLDAARVALEAALRNDPTHLLARINLGEVYVRLAVQAWETAASAMPGDRLLQQRLRLARELAAVGAKPR